MDKTQIGADNLKISPSLENPEKTVKVYFGIFFDGTKNHRGQAIIGEKYRELIETGVKKSDAKKDTGYTANDIFKDPIEYVVGSAQQTDQSNIALLEPFYLRQKELVCTDKYLGCLYIEGIGTNEDGSLQALGLMAGSGETGIKTKVKNTINNKVPARIGTLGVPLKSNIELYFELFGFSRGAAAARHCVWSVLEDQKAFLKDALLKRSFNVVLIKVDYVGLFDTVSSYSEEIIKWESGIPQRALDFNNDVTELNLNAISQAKYVLQICAADEFRKNFALTNIESASGLEIYMPGDHCDIGGGHPAGAYEVTLKTLDTTVYADWQTVPSVDCLKELGWIRETPNNYSTSSGTIKFKNKQSKGYSYISLVLMAEEANEKVDVELFNINNINNSCPIPSSLSSLKHKAKASTSIELCASTFKDYKYDLRTNWLHFSSEKSMLNSPRIDEEKGVYERQIIPG